MRPKNYRSLPTYVLAFLLSSSANAVMINFDELDPESIPNSILTNEYESQGLIFEYSAYLTYSSTQSAPNYAVGPGFMLNFINELPTYVSFYTGSSTQSKVFISATGPNEYLESIITEGEIHGMGSLESTPYIPNQFVVFQSEFGIASIELSGQSDAYVDDLSFYYEGEEIAVSEPSALILFILGLGCIIRKKFLLG